MARNPGSPYRELVMRIAHAVARIYHTDPLWIIGPRRTRNLSEARHAVYWVLRFVFNLSWPEIGSAMDRDHTSAAKGVKRFNNRFLSDPLLSAQMGTVIRDL